MSNEIPYDNSNSSNPWLLNKNLNELIIGPEGVKLTAEYIWSKQGKDRENLVQWVFDYYRNNGFPKCLMTNEELNKEFDKLILNELKDICIEVDGEKIIKNSNSSGTDILKHFSGELFYSAKGKKDKTKSCIEVFNDDEMLKKVLKNRMGYCKTSEDGTERPYVFSISDSMIIQGMRSSGLAYTVSTFKPCVAKYAYKHCANMLGITNELNIFDYSAGWGARALGAGSLKNLFKINYTGFDPLTFDCINNIMNQFNISGKVFNSCAEDSNAYEQLKDMKNQFDIAFSSPPYFNLENYSNDLTQSDVAYGNYESWLELFWKKVVENCLEFVLKKENRIFGVVIVEKVEKHDIGADMINICEKLGLKLVDKILFKTSKSHLSGKKQTGSITKKTEGIYLFK